MQPRYFRKWLIWALTLMLVITSIPLDAFAESSNTSNSEVELENTTQEKVEKTKVIKQRTENTKVYDNGNGTFTRNVYFEPIHKKENGVTAKLKPRIHLQIKKAPGLRKQLLKNP